MKVQQSGVTCDRLSPAWQELFLTHLLPKVKTQARFGFRNLPAGEREEAEADAIAVALVTFVRLTERGRDPSAFAVRIARVAIWRVKAGRVIGTGERSQDVLSRLSRQRHGVRVESLDSHDGKHRGGWQQILVEDRKSSPAETAASRIDVGEWLGRMTSRRRQIAESLGAGYRTEEVAEKFNLSRGRISQLRRAFEDSWNDFQRDACEQIVPGGTGA